MVMRRECRANWEGLVRLAEGREDPADEHVSVCVCCQAELERLQKLLAAARYPMQPAPADVVDLAKAIMQGERRRTVLGNVLRTSLHGAASRGPQTEFTVVVGDEVFQTRLLVSREWGGWQVVGRAPSDAWRVQRGEEEHPCVPDGRFALTVPTLEESGFTLRGPEFDLVVPPLTERAEHGSGSGR